MAGEQLKRKEDLLQIQPTSMPPVFEEIPSPATQMQADTSKIIASVRMGRSSVDVYQGASTEIVAAIFKGLSHAK